MIAMHIAHTCHEVYEAAHIEVYSRCGRDAGNDHSSRIYGNLRAFFFPRHFLRDLHVARSGLEADIRVETPDQKMVVGTEENAVVVLQVAIALRVDEIVAIATDGNFPAQKVIHIAMNVDVQITSIDEQRRGDGGLRPKKPFADYFELNIVLRGGRKR